jgi:Ca2+/Na+ antiporter
MFLQLHQGNIKMFLWYNCGVWMAQCSAQDACWMTKESRFCFLLVQAISSFQIWGSPIILFSGCWGLCPQWYRGRSVKLTIDRCLVPWWRMQGCWFFKCDLPLWWRWYKFRKNNRQSQYSLYTDFIALHLMLMYRDIIRQKKTQEKLSGKILCVFYSVYACVEISTYIS